MAMSGNPVQIPDLKHLRPEYIAYSNAPALLAQTGALFGTAVLIVILRCYVRAKILKSFGKDDWAMLLASTFALATFIVYANETNVGLGKHVAIIKSDAAGFREFNRLRQAHSILAAIGIGIAKISIAFFLMRFVTQPAYRWSLHGFCVFMTLFVTGCVLAMGKRARSKLVALMLTFLQ